MGLSTLKEWCCCCCSVPKLYLTLCNPMDCSIPGFPVLHYLPEFDQIHVHWVDDTIQPFHPLSSPSSPAHNPSQHQGLFQWVSFASAGQSIDVSASATVLPMNIPGWFTLGLTGLILWSKGLSRVFNRRYIKLVSLIRLHLLSYRECLTDLCAMQLPAPSFIHNY